MSSSALRFITHGNLIIQVAAGIVIGALLALFVPGLAQPLTLFGTLFVSALKAVAPLLVFFLVMASLAAHESGKKTTISTILLLYLIGTFSAAVIAVIASQVFQVTLTLKPVEQAMNPVGGIVEVLKNLLLNMMANPIRAISEGNFIGILTWAVLLGIGLRQAQPATRKTISDLADAITWVVRIVIRFAPLGVMGLVIDAILTSGGLAVLREYSTLLGVLLGCMFFVALVINPFIVWTQTRRNPYPLVFTCLRESGVTAFFTRSSAANIPVNLTLAKKLGLNEDTYSISIPLGATINMTGAAITITVLTLAAVHTLNIEVSFGTAVFLSFLATLGACGASGVAGGSLLLIPMACSLFGIPLEISSQVIGVGFVISVLQDSTETALNSSTDVLFTAASDPVFKNGGPGNDML